MGLVCIQNSSLLVYSKSQKVSASYCLPFRHSRGKNQPVGGFRPPPPACLGLNQSFVDGEMSISQRQAVITLIEKKVKIKGTFKTGVPIFDQR